MPSLAHPFPDLIPDPACPCHPCPHHPLQVGYHNEHHDFPQIPQTRLHKVRAQPCAPSLGGLDTGTGSKAASARSLQTAGLQHARAGPAGSHGAGCSRASSPPLHHPFQLREIAPEYYDSLYAHTSWCWVLWRFIVDPKMGPWSRMHRVLREGTPEANDAFIGSLCKVRCGSRRQRRQWQRWQQRWELRLLLRTGRPGAIPACATTARARQAALLQRRCNATSRCALCCRLPRRLAPPRPRAPLLCSIRAVLLRCRCGDEGAGWAGRRWKQGLTTLVPAVVHLPVPALIPNAP